MSLSGPYHPLKVDELLAGVIGRVAVHLGFDVVQAKPSAGWVLLILANNGGEKRKFQADYVICGTCYRPELSRVPFLIMRCSPKSVRFRAHQICRVTTSPLWRALLFRCDRCEHLGLV